MLRLVVRPSMHGTVVPAGSGCCDVAGRVASWAEGMAARFVFVDYDEHHTSKK
jgi:hypothetical protein